MLFENIFLIMFIIAYIACIKDYSKRVTPYKPTVGDSILIILSSLIITIMILLTIILTGYNLLFFLKE